MTRRISYRPYRRDFLRPLETAHGTWAVREGFVLRVEEGGRVGYGEVAPIPEFGTETLAEAGAFLRRLAEEPGLPVPGELLCCAFGLSAALCEIGADPVRGSYELAGLLPAGEGAQEQARLKRASGYRTLKWKIGLKPPEEEMALCAQLLAAMPIDARLRLDANGGLDQEGLGQWLDFLRKVSRQIEFLEQPLPPGHEQVMAELSASMGIPIALDESLNGPAGRRWLETGAWDGPLVVKPLLMGDVFSLAGMLRPQADRVVYSSVFETAFGLRNAMSFAATVGSNHYALGFDILGAFDDPLVIVEPGSTIAPDAVNLAALDELWNRLPLSH